MGDFRNLIAYKKSYALAMEIFQTTKSFPKEERYSLTDQIRRSSRSVCANIAEAYRRRSSKTYFVAKLGDSETENAETQVWLDFSTDCGYIDKNEYDRLLEQNSEVGKLIFYMINNPENFY